jgi:hypothetical protein
MLFSSYNLRIILQIRDPATTPKIITPNMTRYKYYTIIMLASCTLTEVRIIHNKTIVSRHRAKHTTQSIYRLAEEFIFVVTITILDIIHRYVFSKTTFRTLDSVFVFKWNLLSWIQHIRISLSPSPSGTYWVGYNYKAFLCSRPFTINLLYVWLTSQDSSELFNLRLAVIKHQPPTLPQWNISRKRSLLTDSIQ